MAKPGNDSEFKKHVLRKLIALENNQKDQKSDFKIFKLKAYGFIVALVAAKDHVYKFFFH